LIKRKTYNQIVDLYSDRIYTYLLKHLKDSNTAQDVTQDCFLQLWKHRKTIEEETVKAWLFKTAYNIMLNQIRKHKKLSYEATLNDNIMEDRKDDYETKDLLNQVFEFLTPHEKSLVLLKDVEGYNYQEIASMHDISLSSVKSHLFRARQKMKNAVSKLKATENNIQS